MPARWAAVHGERLVHGVQGHMPLDSPSGTTGLTPRAAGLMRPSPASPRFAASARPQPQAPLASGLDQLQGQCRGGPALPGAGGDSGHVFAAHGGQDACAQAVMGAQQVQQLQYQELQLPHQQQGPFCPGPPAAVQDYAAQQQPQPAWELPSQQQLAGLDPFAKRQGCAQEAAWMQGSWDKALCSLHETGEGGAGERSTLHAMRCARYLVVISSGNDGSINNGLHWAANKKVP